MEIGLSPAQSPEEGYYVCAWSIQVPSALQCGQSPALVEPLSCIILPMCTALSPVLPSVLWATLHSALGALTFCLLMC